MSESPNRTSDRAAVGALMELAERLKSHDGHLNLFDLMRIDWISRVFRDNDDMYAELRRADADELLERIQLDGDLEVAALDLIRAAEREADTSAARLTSGHITRFDVWMNGRRVYRFLTFSGGGPIF
jgi:hypothetical protein